MPSSRPASPAASRGGHQAPHASSRINNHHNSHQDPTNAHRDETEFLQDRDDAIINDLYTRVDDHDAAMQKVSAAMIAAMGEVDTLRAHVDNENAVIRNIIASVRGEVHGSKAVLEREMRETIDTVIANLANNVSSSSNVVGGMVDGSAAVGVGAPNNAQLVLENRQLRSRLDSLEASVRSLQLQQAPLSIEKVLTQTKTFLEQTDKEVEVIRKNVEEKMRWVDGKVSAIVSESQQKDVRLQEQLDAFTLQQSKAFEEMTTAMRKRETAFIAQQQQQNQTLLALTTGGGGAGGSGPTEVILPPEVELKMAQLSKQSAAVDKRVMMAEESIAQLDAEQRDLVTSIQSLRAAMQAEKIRNSQTRVAGGGGGGGGLNGEGLMGEALTVVTIRDEVIRTIENDQITRNRQIKEEIIAIRADVQKALAQADRSAGDVTRIANQHQGVQQSLTRVESNVATMQERLEGEMRAQFSRAEVAQKAFFARQDQLLANERHQIATKLSSDIQQMQQKSLQEHQAAEIRRTDDIRASHTQLRDDFNRFVSEQRLEVEKTHATLRDYVQHQTKEQGDVLSKQFREITDDTRRAMINAMDDVKKLASRTSEELGRIKSAVDDNTQRLSEQHQYLHNRVQQILDEEVKRFDRLAEDSRLRLTQQIESEVSRAVASTEGSLVRAYHAMKEQQEREGRLVKEELEGLRGSLTAIAAPSTTMAALESRVDTLRRDLTQLHVNLSRFTELEAKMASTLNYEMRKVGETVRGDVLRDVTVQLQRFDRALSELSNEQQAQYNALINQVRSAKDHTDMAIDTLNASLVVTLQQQQQQQQLASAKHHHQAAGSALAHGHGQNTFGGGLVAGGGINLGSISRAGSTNTMIGGGGGGGKGFRLPPAPSRSGTPNGVAAAAAASSLLVSTPARGFGGYSSSAYNLNPTISTTTTTGGAAGDNIHLSVLGGGGGGGLMGINKSTFSPERAAVRDIVAYAPAADRSLLEQQYQHQHSAGLDGSPSPAAAATSAGSLREAVPPFDTFGSHQTLSTNNAAVRGGAPAPESLYSRTASTSAAVNSGAGRYTVGSTTAAATAEGFPVQQQRADGGVLTVDSDPLAGVFE